MKDWLKSPTSQIYRTYEWYTCHYDHLNQQFSYSVIHSAMQFWSHRVLYQTQVKKGAVHAVHCWNSLSVDCWLFIAYFERMFVDWTWNDGWQWRMQARDSCPYRPANGQRKNCRSGPCLFIASHFSVYWLFYLIVMKCYILISY